MERRLQEGGGVRRKAEPCNRLAVLLAPLLLCAGLAQPCFAPALAAATSDAVEQDAQAYTKLAIRHDQLLLKLNMKRASPQEEKEMDELAAQGAALKSKYAPGGPMSKQAAAFERRLKELSEQVVQPAIRKAVGDAFPSVDEVRGAYPDPAHAIAALQILERMMVDKVGQPQPPATKARVDAYHAAVRELNPQSASGYTALLDASDKLQRSREFAFEVLDRFVPVYAGEAGSALNKERYEARANADEQSIYRWYVIVGIAVLVVPFLFLVLGRRGGGKPRLWRADDAWPFQLSPELRRVEVLGKRFFLTFDCGIVTEKRVIEETTKSTTTTQDTSSAGGITVYGPMQSSTSTTKRTYHRYYLHTPDDRKVTRTYPAGEAEAEVGQLVSSVDAGDSVLVSRNHSTGEHGVFRYTVGYVNRFPAGWVWAASVVVAFVGLSAVQRYVVETGEHSGDWRFSYMVGSLTLLMAIVSGVYLRFFKSVVEKIRVRRFERGYVPQLERFMQERTPLLQKHYSHSSARLQT